MKEIKYLAEYMQEELEDAEKYAKAAVKLKDNNKDLAETYADLARQELSHSEMLHTQAVRLIKAQTAAGVKAPPSMQAVWDWEHEKVIEHTAKIKRILEIYHA